MSEERNSGQVTGSDPRGLRALSAVIALLGAGFGLCGCGRHSVIAQPGPRTQQVLLVVATNYLSCEPWPLGLLTERDQHTILRKEFSFKRGDYSIDGLCKEITRATGKRVEWLPDDREALDALYKEWGETGLCSPPPSIATEEDRQSLASRCSVSLGVVLEHLISRTTDAQLHTESLNRGIWTAWVGNDAIFLVLLPRRIVPQEEFETYKAPKGASENKSESAVLRGLYRIAVVLPENNLFAALRPDLETLGPEDLVKLGPWVPAIPPMVEQDAILRRTIRLAQGEYTVESFAEEIARAAGLAVRWLTPADRPLARGPASLLKKPFFQVGDAADFATLQGIRLNPQLQLGQALGVLLATATEIGVGRKSPDREVWTALVGNNEIFLIQLPDGY